MKHSCCLFHVDAVWRTAGCECLQEETKEQRGHGSLWTEHFAFFMESTGVITQSTGAISPMLHTCLLALPLPFVAFLPLQCWNCRGLLREWGDERRCAPADVLAAPRQPHCGRRPGQGEHPKNGTCGHEQPPSAPLLLDLAVPVSLPVFSSYLGSELC